MKPMSNQQNDMENLIVGGAYCIMDFAQILYKSIVYHTPKEKLNDSEIAKIQSNGLIHFCNSKNKDKILQEGVKSGLKAPMRKAEKNYTWYYIYEDETYKECQRIVQSKGERKSYNVYIIIKGLTEEQINKLRIRRKNDNAVIYPGTLKTDTMEAHYIDVVAGR